MSQDGKELTEVGKRNTLLFIYDCARQAEVWPLDSESPLEIKIMIFEHSLKHFRLTERETSFFTLAEAQGMSRPELQP